jgi:hypothetical protein
MKSFVTLMAVILLVGMGGCVPYRYGYYDGYYGRGDGYGRYNDRYGTNDGYYGRYDRDYGRPQRDPYYRDYDRD